VSEEPTSAVRDQEALAEIELCGDLIIAASSAAGEERLSAARIDEVLRVMKPLHEIPPQRGPLGGQCRDRKGSPARGKPSRPQH
jgi:hypothetical protein